MASLANTRLVPPVLGRSWTNLAQACGAVTTRVEANPRLRLVLLVAIALSSTTTQPLAWLEEGARERTEERLETKPFADADIDADADPRVVADRGYEVAALGSVRSVAARSALSRPESQLATANRANETDPETYARVNDAIIAAQIDRRLARRHTGLSVRERTQLAHAIVREARAFGLEPELVIAVIEVESAGYPLAVSHVGALGLMQLLPSTAEELAGKIGVEWKGDDTLFDPLVNVRLGTAYLKQLADKYDGNVNVALAAYNWGPGRIDRRLRRGATVPSKYIEQVRRAYDRGTELASRSS